jgi:hypothetical protein
VSEMKRSVIHKALLARRMYELARDGMSSDNDHTRSVAVNLMQDALECFLIAVADHVGAGIDERTSVYKYFALINQRIVPSVLPHQERLFDLNKIRNVSKHSGICPAKSESASLGVLAHEFFETVCRSVLHVEFSLLTMVDLIRDEQTRNLLKEAEVSFRNGNYGECLVTCRKVVYLNLESRFDAGSILTSEEPLTSLMNRLRGTHREWPDKQTLEKTVRDATELILLDRDMMEILLLKEGINSTAFWNVRRLSPAVYHDGEAWTIKEEFDKLTGDDLKERAEYVLDTTVDMFLTADQRSAAHREAVPLRHVVTLSKKAIRVYEKANSKSAVVATTPKDLMELDTDFVIDGFRQRGKFYHVNHLVRVGSSVSLAFCGYIAEQDVASVHKAVAPRPTKDHLALVLAGALDDQA